MPPKNIDPNELENARICYQVAVNLWTYQGNLNWSRFNVMLTVNSIIVAVIEVLSNQSSTTALASLLPYMGLFLCLVWIFLTSRGFDYHTYWSSQARKLEKKYFGGVTDMIVNGRSNKRGGKIKFTWLSEMFLISNIGKQWWASFFVITLFIIVYIVVLINKEKIL